MDDWLSGITKNIDDIFQKTSKEIYAIQFIQTLSESRPKLKLKLNVVLYDKAITLSFHSKNYTTVFVIEICIFLIFIHCKKRIGRGMYLSVIGKRWPDI